MNWRTVEEKWISNDTNSFKVVPEGAIDSVEVYVVVRVDVVKKKGSLGPLPYNGILNDVNSIFWDRIYQTSPEREFNYSGIVICCYFPFIYFLFRVSKFGGENSSIFYC